jgi:ABC-type antimicrobial peptide transport system permease subunit
MQAGRLRERDYWLQRTREVGLLKALGVTRRQVLNVFLIEAAIISTAASVPTWL